METPTWSVSELASAVRSLLSAAFPDEIWVTGEIASLRRGRNGHVWFDLVESEGGEATALLPVVLFDDVRREVNALLRASGVVRMTDGVEVRVRGRVDLRSAQGRLQLRMTGIDPTHTLGRLVAARDELIRRLTAEGLAARNPALGLPEVPLRIGVVGSAGSAGCTDLLEELRGSGLGFRVSLVDTPVQGERAPAAVAGAIAALGARDVDAIALIRGGGARTDLVVFDHEQVARAIAFSPVPVVTGIGHDIDMTVADAMAHTAAKTPTACAGVFIEQMRRSVQRVEAVAQRLPRLATTAVRAADRRLLRRAGALSGAARVHLRVASDGLDRRSVALVDRSPRAVRSAGRRVESLALRAESHDPVRAMRRGWSVTRTADGAVVREPSEVAGGDTLVTTVAGGRIRSEVTEPQEEQ